MGRGKRRWGLGEVTVKTVKVISSFGAAAEKRGNELNCKSSTTPGPLLKRGRVKRGMKEANKDVTYLGHRDGDGGRRVVGRKNGIYRRLDMETLEQGLAGVKTNVLGQEDHMRKGN